MGTNHESPQMQTLHAIREQRSQKVNEARSLLASMPTLTPEAQTKFDAIKAEIVNLEGQEARAQFVEDAERRSLGTPVHKSEAALEGRVNVLDAIRCQVENRSATGALAEFQQQAGDFGHGAGDDGQRWRQGQAGDIAVSQRAFQRPALGVNRHHRPVKSAPHEVAGQENIPVAAAANERNGFGFKKGFEITGGHNLGDFL